MDVIDVTLVADTSIYANNDVLAVPLAVPGFLRASDDVRKITSIVVLDEAANGTAIDLVFLNADATLGTINGVVSITDADARKILGIVQVAAADYSDLIGSKLATKRDVNLIVKAASPGTTLWIGAIVRSGTPTYAASSLKLKIGVE